MNTMRKNTKQIISFRIFYRSHTQILYLLLIYCFAFPKIHAQSDLQADSVFFLQQVEEFGNWLDTTNISSIAHIDHLEIYSDNLSLILESNYKTDDSLKVAWNSLQEQYDNTQIEQISERILNTFAFLCDIGPDSVTIYIKGREFKDSGVKIYYKDYIRVDENFSNVLSSGIFEINLKDIRIEHGKRMNTLSSGTSVSQVRKSISDYLLNYYSDKNGGWYKVNVDTTRNFFNKFTYRITCIKNEIISDGYFEFIQIQIKVYQKDDDIQVSIDVQGKYASGILCPNQREKFYKSMETTYPGTVERYTELMLDRINNHLKGG